QYHQVGDTYLGYGKTNLQVMNTNVAIASFITAYARLHMLDFLEDLDNRGYKVLYGDTDSAYTTGNIKKDKYLYEKWFGEDGKGDEMGKMKAEKENIEVVIAGLKFMGIKDAAGIF